MKRVLTLLLILVLVLAAFVACNDEKPGDNTDNTPPAGDGNTDGNEADADLQAAYDYIKLTYKNLTATTATFEVMKNAPIGEKIFAITWSTDNAAITVTESEDGNFYVVNIPELGDAAISYTLKFSVQNDKGEKKEGSFNLTVPALKINTYDEYAAAEDGELLIVEGIVTGVISVSNGTSSAENSIYVQDLNGNGGYYAYNLATDPAGTIKVGMTVRVSGNKKTYNGNYELVNPVATVLDSTITPVTPVDFTEILAGADSLEAPELVGKNGMLVKISGVTLLEYNQDKGYHHFKLGNHKTYLRVSSSANCITKAEGEAITELFESKFYNGADVVGIITVYNGAFYLIPVSAEPFTNFVEQEIPADVKVDIAMDELTVPGFIQLAGNTKLPTAFANFSDLTVTWELLDAANLTGITLNGDTLTVVIPDEATIITLKATFTIGDVSKTKEYTVTVKDIDTITIKEADDMVADFVKNQYTDELFYVIGTIEQISSDKYGNMYIVAIIDGAEYGIDIYGMYDENNKKYGDFEGYKPKVGDTVKVRTTVGKYNNAQLKNAVLVEYNHNYDAGVVTPPTCQAEGYTTYTCACGHSYVDENSIVPTVDHFYGEGVTETTDLVCTYCGVKNHTHTTEAGEIVPPTCTAEGYTVYGCTDADCAFTEHKDAQPKLAHNDTDGDFLCDADGCDAVALPAADSVLTIEQAIALGKALGGSYTTDKYYVTGTIKNVYNDQYGNMYIKDENGNEFCIYGTYSADGKIRYDALTGKPVAGDVITVYGVIGSYGTTPQMKNGWIQHSNTEIVTPPTCTEGGYTTYTCKFCGATSTGAETEALEHNFVDGVCDRAGCGALDHVHNYEYSVVVTAPTCTEGGYTTKTCECGDTQKVDELPALNHIDENGDYKCDRTGCTVLVLPEDGTVLTVAEALKIGALFKNNTGASYAANKYYIVGRITAITSTKYGTCEIMDATGTISVYGLRDATGKIIYENLEVKPVVGDTVKIYGQLGAYYQGIQFNNSAVVEHTPHTTCEFSEATCKAPATCSICGKTEGELGEHNYVSGVCSVCGHEEGAAEVVTATGVVDFTKVANRTTFNTSKQVWEGDGIVVTNNKGKSTSNVADYSNPGRFYKGSDLIIEKAGITKIVIDCHGLDNKYVKPFSGLKGDNITVTSSNKIITIEFTTAVDSFTISNLSAQARAYSITVTYIA